MAMSELHDGLEGVVAADLLDVDLLEGVVAQFVAPDELVLYLDSPEDEEGRNDQDDNECSRHSINGFNDLSIEQNYKKLCSFVV